jgi:hypothetical protein
MFKVGFTGTRSGMTFDQKMSLADLLGSMRIKEFHHGDCVGADAEAHDMIDDGLDIYIVIHPPLNPSKRAHKKGNWYHEPLPYLVRNKNIVNDTDILIACPGEIAKQLMVSGTWSTVRYARTLGRPIKIVFPDGSVKTEN